MSGKIKTTRREIPIAKIIQAVKNICITSNYHLDDRVIQALKRGLNKEESPIGKDILKQIIKNARIADQGVFPLCQDTGMAVFFVEIGQNVCIPDGNLYDAIIEGVRRGYREGYLRNSIVLDPLRRHNSGDNTPPIIWSEVVPGETLKITMAPKGGGSENMSQIAMLKPGDGAEGIKKFVLDWISSVGGNPCPPIIVGIGIGGNFEKSAWLSKKAILRPLGISHTDPFWAEFEQDLLNQINALGIGPQGLGGRLTALAVHIETYPCHIASLPVAVNLQCHAARHKSILL
ncbi:fumarate hydratase [candidate division KSB1 bacterium]|nr:fumarate hydratase [candidate division KSB1 bacterium]